MCELERDISELDRLRTQLAKANEDYKTLFSAFESCQGELKKANERVAELEKNQPPIENGKNRYGLDISYFRNVINRELNRPLDNYKPDELARVLARLSRTADELVMFEPEFSNKFAIEKKIEFKNDLIKHLRNNYTWTHSVYEFIDSFGEQLRKEQDSEQ